jgi:hypothetical protein
MYLKLDDDTKHLVEEISALSGIQRDVVREVWEFTLVRWIELITRDPEKLQTLAIPFLGQIGVRYTGDALRSDGSLETQAEAFVSLSPLFLHLLGDIYDEKTNLLTDILEKKIDDSVASSVEASN